jgi:anti-sigma regulatory factor (Ser/Thr protein kinase)
MLNGIASAPGRIQPLPQGPDSPAPAAPGFPDPLAGHSRSQEEGDYRGHGAGAHEEVRAASVVLLPCVPSSVAVARGRIGAELRQAGLPATAVADAALVTSELLSNAILHARPLPDACIRVSWILSATAVEIIVSDGGSATRPRASRPSLSSIGGRGLGIVEHLCSSWGVRADERGTTVWVVVPASRDGSAGPGGGGPGGCHQEHGSPGPQHGPRRAQHGWRGPEHGPRREPPGRRRIPGEWDETHRQAPRGPGGGQRAMNPSSDHWRRMRNQPRKW